VDFREGRIKAETVTAVNWSERLSRIFVSGTENAAHFTVCSASCEVEYAAMSIIRLRLIAVVTASTLLISCGGIKTKSATPPPPPSTTTAVAVNSNAVARRAGPAAIYRRADLNPGFPNPDVTQANIAQNICNKNWSTSSIRPPSSYTTKLKVSQITQYGFSDKNLSDYEEDHIISLENGGDPRDGKNLYPEAYNTKVNGQRIGAHEKDAVENYVQNGICLNIPNAKFSVGPKPPRAVTLAQGQKILSTDW
jgi:hypothetical protein